GLNSPFVMYDPTQDKFLPKEEYLKIAKEDPGRIVVIFVPPRKKWMPDWLKMPHMTVAGDGMLGMDAKGKLLGWDSPYEAYAGHPRTAGSHAKVLRMGREAGIPLMHTLSQLSYWSALHLGQTGVEAMKVRGRMQEGMVADIAIFDPKKVKDNAGYKPRTNGLPSTAIPYVLVNGRFVVRESKVVKAMAGQEIRFPVEEKGRFVPATTEQWLKNFTIDSSPLAPKAKPAKQQPKAEETSSIDSAPDHEPFVRPTTTALDPLDPNILSVDRTLPEKQQWFGDSPYRSLGYCCGFHWQQAQLAGMNRATALSTED
ncbi:unnamed protein product, partial [marine sediment metagenome]